MRSIIEILNATVYRGQHQVFKSLSLNFKLGENVAILGPNGAGKTTLIKLITREISPVVKQDSHIKLFGNEKTIIWELRQKIGLVSHDFQNDYRALATGEDVVISAFFGSIGLHSHNIVTQQQRKKAHEIIEELGLVPLLNRQYLQLSTGQQRRLLLARALVHNPDVLIFDEPTAGLDLQASVELVDSMRSLSNKGKTLILVTHHLQELIPEIDRIVMVKNGELFADGNKTELMNSENISRLYNTQVKVIQQDGFYHATPCQTR